MRHIKAKLPGVQASANSDIETIHQIFIVADKNEWRASCKRLHVAIPGHLCSIDGEVTLMDTPLHYRVRPGALRVIVPQSLESSAVKEVEHAHARTSL